MGILCFLYNEFCIAVLQYSVEYIECQKNLLKTGSVFILLHYNTDTLSVFMLRRNHSFLPQVSFSQQG